MARELPCVPLCAIVGVRIRDLILGLSRVSPERDEEVGAEPIGSHLADVRVTRASSTLNLIIILSLSFEHFSPRDYSVGLFPCDSRRLSLQSAFASGSIYRDPRERKIANTEGRIGEATQDARARRIGSRLYSPEREEDDGSALSEARLCVNVWLAFGRQP